MKKTQELPNRGELRAAARDRFMRPMNPAAGGLVGKVPEGDGWTGEQLQAAFEEALFERRMGDALHTARETRGITGVELARRTGVSPMRISQLERVGGNVEVQTLSRVADALGYDVTVTLTPREGGRAIIASIARPTDP